MKTAIEYLRLLQSLLPKGAAWNRDESSVLTQFLHGQAEEFSRADERSDDLLDEIKIDIVSELITDYEIDFSLPDECSDPAETLIERRNIIHTKLISLGQQDKQYFIDLAAALGYEITITEHKPFWAGVGAAGDPCGDQDVIFHWTVNALYGADTIYFVAGSGAAGDPLVRYPALTLLECTIKKYKPGHTTVSFVYTGYAYDMAYDAGYDSIPSEEDINLDGGFGRGFGLCFNRAFGGGFDSGGFNSGFAQPS